MAWCMTQPGKVKRYLLICNVIVILLILLIILLKVTIKRRYINICQCVNLAVFTGVALML